MGRGDRRHYNLVAHKVAGEAEQLKRGVTASSHRIVYRNSRCPGCRGKVTLKYQVEKVDGSYRYHLLSPSIAHAACETALEEIRKANPAWFKREINAKD